MKTSLVVTDADSKPKMEAVISRGAKFDALTAALEETIEA